MANNIMLNSIISAVLPTAKRAIAGGKVDKYIQAAKLEYRQQINLQDDENLDILITTEQDGREYINLVIIDSDLHINHIVLQQPLSDFISTLLEKM